MVHRRPQATKSAYKYLPCEYCHGFYGCRQLWAHAKSCYFRTSAVEEPKTYVRDGRLILAPFLAKRVDDMEDIDTVIEKMKETEKNPGLKEICQQDELIKEFGVSLLQRLGTEDEQRRKDQDNVRTKMRSVARLVKKLNDSKLRNLPLDSYISPREFMNVVECVKEVSRESDSPQLAITIGHYLKQIALLKASLGLQTDNARRKKEANDFQELYAAHWKSRVSSVALRSQRLRTINKVTKFPSTEDLVQMKDHLVKEIGVGMKNTNPHRML